MGNFRGEIYHTAVWPQYGMNTRGKRVAEVGTGASGIQVIQEVAPGAKHFTVYQRTLNFCLPMNQRKLDPKEEAEKKKNGDYEKAFRVARETFAGFAYDFVQKNTFDISPEEREALFRQLLIEDGGFRFWLATYKDMLFDQQANDEAYKFWRKMTLKRISDPKKREILCPTKPPHPWATKRPSREQNFYEVVSAPHVDIIDVNENPIEEITATGIRTKLGHVEYDMIILATGFDSVTGSLAQLNIQGTKGQTIAEHWKDGLRTSMGIAMPEFPNMFFLYGPQAPTAFSNGPSCVQFQADWLDKLFKKIIEEDITRMEATDESEEDWTRRMNEKWDITLFPKAKSWYNGANVPGKRVEPLNW